MEGNMKTTIKQIFAISILAASVSMMTGCSPKIDTNSNNITSSIEKVKEGQKPDEIQKFNDALNSVIEYSYAKTHEGRLHNQSGDILAQFSQAINDKLNPKTQQTQDQIIADALNGLTFDDVIRLKPKYDSMTSELVKERKAMVAKVEAQQAIEREKERVAREQQLKEQAKQQVVVDIANTKIDIANADKEIENYETRLKPYADAEKAFEKVTYNNLNIIPGEKGKRWLISFDIDNASELPIYNVSFNLTTTADGVGTTTSSYNENVQEGIQQGVSHTIVIDKSSSSLKKIEDSSNIKASVEINKLTTRLTLNDASGNEITKDYTFDRPVNGIYGPDFMNKAVDNAKTDKARLEKRLNDLEIKKEELYK
jgi:hypothetical protein